jgi:HK97 gp10 family phage protein
MELKGVDVLRGQFARMALGVMQAPAEEIAQPVADRFRQLVPVNTGEYRNSIEVVAEGGGRATIVARAPHAPFVEYGTSDTAAQPALRPAIDTTEDAVHSVAAGVLERIVRSVL